MRLLLVFCLLACVLFVTAERAAQRKRNTGSNNGLQVSASRVASRSRNGALIHRIKTPSAARRTVTRSRFAAPKRRSVRSRSRAAIASRRAARRRFAKQEEADLDQNVNQGFGEETSADAGTDAASSGDSAAAVTPTVVNPQPSVETEPVASDSAPVEPASTATNNNNVAATNPVSSVPANVATSAGNPISAGGFGGFPGNFKFPSFPSSNGAIGAGFAQSQGPGIAFGAGFAASNGQQSTSGGFGAAFSAPNFGLNSGPAAAAQPTAAATEAPAEEELAQIRRRPR